MENQVNKIYIRVEASDEIGFGHLNRCLTLSQSLVKSGIQPVFLIADDQNQTENILKKQGIETVILPAQEKNKVNFYPQDCRCIILDLYHKKNIEDPTNIENIIRDLSAKDIKIFFIDGLFSEAYRPDNNILSSATVIQPYLGAEKDQPPKAQNWIKGHDYVILSEHNTDIPAKNIKCEAENILVTFGGADPQRQTYQVMQSLWYLPDHYTIRIIVGPYFSDSLKKDIFKISEETPGRFEILSDQLDMTQHYAWADIAIGSSGLTKYEFAAYGVPAIISSLSSPHVQSSDVFEAYGLVHHLGIYSEVKSDQWCKATSDLINNYEKRMAMSQQAQSLIRGGGSDRLVEKIITYL